MFVKFHLFHKQNCVMGVAYDFPKLCTGWHQLFCTHTAMGVCVALRQAGGAVFKSLHISYLKEFLFSFVVLRLILFVLYLTEN